ncbi:MAG: lipoyl(octanoyl) transferase LipB [Eubacteriales bacterium]
MMKLNVIDLGTVEYSRGLSIQEKVRTLRIHDKIDDTLLIMEHFPVLTLGCRGKWDNIHISKESLQSMGIEIFKVNRGGDVTYHGPGQIVGYPILNMNNYERDVKGLIWKMKEIFILLLRNEYNIHAIGLDKEHTGVWIDNDKITAIGISISKMVTMHGFAFNVNTNLDHFHWINPCGYTDKGVTSLEKILGYPLEIGEIKSLVVKYFIDVFGIQMVPLNYYEFNRLLEEVENEKTGLAQGKH